jgi:hypothetical protein
MPKNRLHGQRRINDLQTGKDGLCLIRTSMLTRDYGLGIGKRHELVHHRGAEFLNLCASVPLW